MANPRPKLLGELVVALGAVAVFLSLAAAAATGEAAGFDASVRGHIHSVSFPALTYVMRGFTTVGEGVFLVAFGALIVWRLVVAGRRSEALFFAVAALGAELIDQLLKLLFHRARPEAFFGTSPENFSFPSGHALESLCFYLVLAEIFDPEWPRRRRLFARAVAVLFALLIGVSRIYLGIHYPTDVLAGYAAAIAWLAVLHYFRKSRSRQEDTPLLENRGRIDY